MDITQQLYIIEQIKQVKSRYCRGVDTKDIDILTSAVAEQLTQDFTEAMHDPASGYKPNIQIPPSTLPRDKAVRNIMYGLKNIITVHQVLCPDIKVIDENNAIGVWSMSDNVFLKEGTGYAPLMSGYGYYHDTYVREDDGWKIASTRVTRLYVNIAQEKLDAHLKTYG